MSKVSHSLLAGVKVIIQWQILCFCVDIFSEKDFRNKNVKLSLPVTLESSCCQIVLGKMHQQSDQKEIAPYILTIIF